MFHVKFKVSFYKSRQSILTLLLLLFGLMYENGQAVPRDLDEVIKWFQKAADQGHDEAKKHLETLR